MSNVTVKFFEKEYEIPSDVVTYVGLVDFTNDIRDGLNTSFKKQIWPNIDVIESDTFMLSAINEQVAKFIRKLLEHDIYDKTANDYLQANKGYELFLDTKKKVLRQLIAIRKEKLENYRAGVEGAIYRKEASVTGLDFGIISNSFVNHMIYAYMDASEQTKQEQAALKIYNREIAELDKQAAEYDRQENSYVQNSVIPAMNTVFTYFAYELLDRYVSDLIKVGKFDKNALKFIDLERSNDLLENINLANNKRAVIESAFVACPFNMAVYMQAMKLEMLDYESFQAAKVFKQDSKILSFLKESMGAVDYPNFNEPNYYSATLLSRYTNQSKEDILYQHTAAYANAVVREYMKVVNALGNTDRCRSILSQSSEDEILVGGSLSNRLAKDTVIKIVPASAWTCMVEHCGHTDLFDKLLSLMPALSGISNKTEYDTCLIDKLSAALETARIELAQKISAKRANAEAERQKAEKEKQKKRIKTISILCLVAVIIISAISAPSIIKGAKTAKEEKYIESQIQALLLPFENRVENMINEDVTIDYSFSVTNEWENLDEAWYEWTFCVRLRSLDDYRKSDSSDKQALLSIMDSCEILVEEYDKIYDDLDFKIEYKGKKIEMGFKGGNFGSLKIRDLSSSETFYYEEYGGDRYLHSFDTEYILDADYVGVGNEPITQYTPGMFMDYRLGDPVFPSNVSEQTITVDEVNGHLHADSNDDTTIDSLYWVSSNSNGNRQEIVDTAHERILGYFESRYGFGEQVTVPSGVFPPYWGFDDESVTQFTTESGLVYLVGPDSEYNIYVVQIEKPYK